MKIQFIRHATLILHFNNKKILVDPVLSQKGTISAIENVPNKNNNPLVDLQIPIESIVNCDAVFVTHMHRDHFDDMAIAKLSKNITIFCQPEDESKIKEYGFVNVISIKNSLEWEGIIINRTKGKHGHGIIAKKMAPVSGFIISALNEPNVYLMGDTVWYSYINHVLKKHVPDVVICNCGEATFSLGKAITMNSQDILSICNKLPSAKVVAVHMEAWNHCKLSRKALHDFTISNNIEKQVFIPEDGDLIIF